MRQQAWLPFSFVPSIHCGSKRPSVATELRITGAAPVAVATAKEGTALNAMQVAASFRVGTNFLSLYVVFRRRTQRDVGDTLGHRASSGKLGAGDGRLSTAVSRIFAIDTHQVDAVRRGRRVDNEAARIRDSSTRVNNWRSGFGANEGVCDAVIEALGQTPRPGSGLLEKDLHRPIGPGLNTADGSS